MTPETISTLIFMVLIFFLGFFIGLKVGTDTPDYGGIIDDFDKKQADAEAEKAKIREEIKNESDDNVVKHFLDKFKPRPRD